MVGALAGVIGSMMALEAVKLIAGAGEPLTGRLLIYDALAAETRTVTHRRRPGLPGVRRAGRRRRSLGVQHGRDHDRLDGPLPQQPCLQDLAAAGGGE